MISARVQPLVAWDGSSDLSFQDLLASDGDCGAARGRWQVIELVSQSSKPFEARLAWTAGNGSNLTARMTIARSARVGLFSRALRVRVANLANVENKVSGSFAEARTFVQTHNQYEVRGANTSDNGPYQAELLIPPFATHLSVYLVEDEADLSNWYVQFEDGQGTTRSHTPVSKQPDGGFEIGGAAHAYLFSNVELAAWRAVFTLSL